jgi:hypothetical protein
LPAVLTQNLNLKLKLKESNTLLEEFFTFFSRIPIPAENAPFSQEALETAVAQLKASMPADEFRQKCFYFRMIAGSLPPEEIAEAAVFKPHTVNNERLRKTQDFLKENYMKDIRQPDVARHVGLSDGAFCRFLKTQTSKTFSACRNEIQIEAATRMLRV